VVTPVHPRAGALRIMSKSTPEDEFSAAEVSGGVVRITAQKAPVPTCGPLHDGGPFLLEQARRCRFARRPLCAGHRSPGVQPEIILAH
jgi:hypothetical protein